MKTTFKGIVITVVLIFLCGVHSTSVYAGEVKLEITGFSAIIDRMYNNGLTIYTNQEAFRPDSHITRGETSKFVSQFGKLQKLSVRNTDCGFSDIVSYDDTLVPHILRSCEFGLLKGSKNKFYPHGKLTEAQALAIVIRAVDGMLDETGTYRWSDYYEKGQEYNLISSENLETLNDKFITRKKLGRWFYQMSLHMRGEDSSLGSRFEQNGMIFHINPNFSVFDHLGFDSDGSDVSRYWKYPKNDVFVIIEITQKNTSNEKLYKGRMSIINDGEKIDNVNMSSYASYQMGYKSTSGYVNPHSSEKFYYVFDLPQSVLDNSSNWGFLVSASWIK